MNFIAVLAALGLEQWRSFHWRPNLEKLFVRYAHAVERRLNADGSSSDAAPHQSSARQVTTYSNYAIANTTAKDRTCIGDKRAIMCADCAYVLHHELRNIAKDKHAQSVR